jgi:isopropylmalate/homocitrate/citramalate synthase
MLLNDVTLREGDQMPGRDYTADQKIESARALDDLGLPYIQPAFPATGEKDQSVIETLSGDTDAEIIGLARALERDVDAAVDAGADVVETFAPVSELHLEHLLGKSREEMLGMLGDTVEYITDRGATPHVTLADAFRADPEHIVEVFEALPAVEFVNLADSVGARTPTSVQAHLDAIADDVSFDRVGVHFHDDMGCGTANALAAYHAGVGKVDVSIASLGERAGNSSLEEVIVACTVDNDDDLGIETSNLIPVCQDVLDRLGEEWGERKAILGEKISEHESSIHTAAMLSNPDTLEPFDPAAFGGERRLIFGAATGSGGARRLLERVDIELDEETIERYLEVLAANGPVRLEEALDLAREEFGN